MTILLIFLFKILPRPQNNYHNKYSNHYGNKHSQNIPRNNQNKKFNHEQISRDKPKHHALNRPMANNHRVQHRNKQTLPKQNYSNLQS